MKSEPQIWAVEEIQMGIGRNKLGFEVLMFVIGEVDGVLCIGSLNQTRGREVGAK